MNPEIRNSPPPKKKSTIADTRASERFYDDSGRNLFYAVKTAARSGANLNDIYNVVEKALAEYVKELAEDRQEQTYYAIGGKL